MNQSAVGKKRQEILRTFSKHDVCETLSSRQFLERQEAAGISSQKVNTDCWHLLIIFSRANCTSLLPPINVFWWQRARWNNKTARLTAPAKRLTDYSGFYISEQPESEQLPPLAKKKNKESWEFDNNCTNTVGKDGKKKDNLICQRLTREGKSAI